MITKVAFTDTTYHAMAMIINELKELNGHLYDLKITLREIEDGRKTEE